jgi:signal transduction histidine kinase
MITGKSPSGDVKSPRHPYKFLDYYDFEDKDIFFGRENDSRALMQLVISHRVVILFGLSGVGKTSLIKASIIPKIYGTKYVPIYFRPTSSDMRFIIDKNGNMTDASFDANPLEGKVAAHALLLEMNKIGKVPIIFLDQFEQVFMDLERDKFNKITEFLNTLIDHQQLQCHIVISIREDYFARLNDLASSIPSIFNNRFQLKKLDVASARDAIKKPAELVDIYREDDYLQAVLNDLDRDGIEPPQLQIVCTAVFNALPLGWKTLDKNIYKQLGGAESILSGYIGYVLSSFRDGDRDVAREILKCCVSPSLSRILLSLDNIVEILGTKYNKDHIIMVLDTLVFQRLIRSLKTESDFTYELSHEYLIPQIDQWISDEEREIKMIREVMDRERLICKHLNTMIPLERAYYLKSHCDEANLNPSDRELIERSIKEGEKQQHEKKSSDELLTHAQKMEAIGTLTGGIAHDFNNLLMGMQGYVSLSLTDVDQKSVIYERLTVIEQIIRSGAELTKQLLDFSRRGKHEVEVANLNEIVDKTATMFGRTKKEISIHRKYEKDLWTVYVNRNQIEQVLLNLYVNAWQAMPGGGDLLLETRNEILDENYVKSYELKPGPYVKLIVSDTGIGMDESTKKRIFEPFFTTKEMGRGTGLGLASVYGIIL